MLRGTREPLDGQIAHYLEGSLAFHLGAEPKPIEVLGLTISRIKKGERTHSKSGHGVFILRLYAAADEAHSPRRLAINFLVEMFFELREAICGKGKKASGLSKKSQAALTTIGAAIAHKLGIADATALGIAVLILLALGDSAKKAFCKVTTPEEFKKLLSR